MVDCLPHWVTENHDQLKPFSVPDRRYTYRAIGESSHGIHQSLITNHQENNQLNIQVAPLHFFLLKNENNFLLRYNSRLLVTFRDRNECVGLTVGPLRLDCFFLTAQPVLLIPL